MIAKVLLGLIIIFLVGALAVSGIRIANAASMRNPFSDSVCKVINKAFMARGGIVYWDSNRNITVDTTAGVWLMIKTKGSIRDTMPALIVK